MQIDLIETFLDLCETRSFNRTAERLGVTQSTVSARVNSLERAVGCRLLERSRAGTDLTAAGRRFEPHARALRLTWSEARQAARGGGSAEMTLRVGIQHDLVGDQIGVWVRALQAAVPDAALYVEADFSTQMCTDVTTGALDAAILFTPKPHPDLYFLTVGEVSYRMVATDADRLSAVRPETYILANFSPAFSRSHAALLPALSTGPVSSGQNAVVRGLLDAFGGATYLLSETAAAACAEGACRAIADAPTIPQSVYAAIHLRNRHRRIYRRLLECFARALGGQAR